MLENELLVDTFLEIFSALPPSDYSEVTADSTGFPVRQQALYFQAETVHRW